MDIPSAYNSPMNSHPTTPLPSQPGTTNPSPSTSVSTSLINKPGTPHVFGAARRRVPASGLSDRTRKALDGIRTFLGSKSCYDILPESFRCVLRLDSDCGRPLQLTRTSYLVRQVDRVGQQARDHEEFASSRDKWSVSASGGQSAIIR